MRNLSDEPYESDPDTGQTMHAQSEGYIINLGGDNPIVKVVRGVRSSKQRLTPSTRQLVADMRNAGKKDTMTNEEILKVYMQKVDADQIQIRADMRANEERMDTRLNRIEDMIERQSQTYKTTLKTSLSEQEGRLNAKIEDLGRTLEQKMDSYSQEVKDVRRDVRANTIAIVIGIAAIIIAVLFGLPGWLDKFIEGMLG